MPRGWQGLVYIGRSVNLEPSDQTDLNKRRRLDLNGGGELTFEVEADSRDPQDGMPASGGGRTDMAAPRGLLQWRAS